MLIDQFDFDLPKKLIAQKPTSPRDYARMLIYRRDNSEVEFGHFFDLPNYLGENDVLVFNNSKVIPARLVFKRDNKELEIFLLEKVDGLWKALIRPGKVFSVGQKVLFEKVEFEVMGIDENGFRYLKIALDDQELQEFLVKYGQMPIPPYIGENKYQDADYNTVYSAKLGSVAAPTAGLHFTDQLLARLRAKGVQIEFVTLHVGLGTFLPVKVRDTKLHKMHSEKYEIDFQTAKNLNNSIKDGKRIIAVGTTSVRVLEDNFGKHGEIVSGGFETNILIEPGYKWKLVRALITNFHLPKSTLLLLVSAFVGKDKALELYKKAVISGMKFFSFGDGMLIL